MTQDELGKVITEELKSYSNNCIYLINTSPEKYHSTRIALLEQLLNKLKHPGLYVTLNLPSKAITSELNENHIESSRLTIVEGINQKTGMTLGLVELSIKVTTLINTGKYDFMVFDSASTLLISNNIETIERFLSFMVNKARHLEKHLFILFVNDEKSQKVANLISQSCDKYIKL